MQEWQIQDAARLKRLWNEKKPGTQAAFGADFEIGNQAAVWQYLNARIPLNLDAAQKFAKGLKVDVAEFSPTLAKKRDALAAGGAPAGTHTLTAREELVLELLRGLTAEQVEEELLPALRATFDANRATQKMLANKLKTTGNRRVEQTLGAPRRAVKPHL